MLGGISEQFSHLGNSIWEGMGGEDWACRHHRLPVDTRAQGWLGGQWPQWVSLGSPLEAGRANKWSESPRAVWDAVSFASLPLCGWRNRQERTRPGRLVPEWVRGWAGSTALHSRLPAAPVSQALYLLEWPSWVIILSPHGKIHPLIVLQLLTTVELDREAPCVNLFLASWTTRTSCTQECISICVGPPVHSTAPSPPRYTPITRVRGMAAVRTLVRLPNTQARFKDAPAQRDGTGREEGGGFRMGNTCIPVADSCWYMAKPIQYYKVK